MQFPFPLLVCDVGGTNARFALVTEPAVAPSGVVHRATNDFSNLEAATADVLPTLGRHPRSMIVCAAGPVEDTKVVMTNAHWTIEGRAIANTLKLDQGLLLNDFEAQALTLPVIKDEWVKVLGDASFNDRGARLVLGPGTGLGASTLLEVNGKHFALASEAGHVDFGPVGSEEAAIWPHLPMGSLGRISAELVLSGPGLVRLHQARQTARGNVTARRIDEKTLVERAHAEPQGDEAQTVRLFWRLAARYAGDMTLAFLATGGVTFCGGVLPRILSFVDPAMFRARFEDKAPYGDILRRIGTRLIVVDDAVLTGMSAIAAHPDAYAIDYDRRAWRR